MPFNRKALLELIKRENTVPSALAFNISRFIRTNNLENTISKQIMCKWVNGDITPSWNNVDLLYRFASSKGYNDLEFYQKPDELPKNKVDVIGPLNYIKNINK